MFLSRKTALSAHYQNRMNWQSSFCRQESVYVSDTWQTMKENPAKETDGSKFCAL
jgi:hypothetical protein